MVDGGTAATQQDVTDALDALNTAKTTFTGQKALGTKFTADYSTLTAKIGEANTAKTDIV